MKKWISILLTAVMLATACVPAFAAVSSYELFTQWESSGYPEYVTGVFYNTETGHLSVLLKGNTAEQQAALTAQLSDAVDVTYFEGQYSHAQLEDARAAIAAEMAETKGENGLVGVGIGWSTVTGGFGESGKDFRVVAAVTDERAAEYRTKYAEAYGDMVVVDTVSAIDIAQDIAASETDTQLVDEETAPQKQGLSDWGIIGIAAIVLGGLVLGLNRFRKLKQNDKDLHL